MSDRQYKTHQEMSDDELVGYIDGLVRLSLRQRRKYAPPAQLDQNLQFYLGDQIDYEVPDGLRVLVINKIQNAVIAALANMTEQDVAFTLAPTSPSDHAIYFFKPEVGGALIEARQAATLSLPPAIDRRITDDQLAGLSAIDAELYKDLLGATAQRSPQPQPELGQPQPPIPQAEPEPAPIYLFNEDDFIMVDDAAVTAWEQTILNSKWKKSGGQIVLNENILGTVIYGWNPMVAEYQPRRHGWNFFCPPLKRVYLDPRHAMHMHQDYIAYDENLTLDEAMSRFAYLPKAKLNQVREAAQVGRVSMFSEDHDDWHEMDMDDENDESIVVVRRAYLRHSKYQAGEDEAIAYGWVTRAEASPAGTPQPTNDKGEPLPYLLPDGKPTGPKEANWPKTTDAVRQLLVVNDVIIEDQRCFYADVPILWNRAYPIPGKPWGQGLPEKAIPINRAINEMGSDIYTHVGYYASPMEASSDVIDGLAANKQLAELGAFPGRKISLPHEIFKELGGKLSIFTSPPELPQSLVEFFRMLITDVFDDLMNTSSVTRGTPDPNASSGRAIDSLQASARGIFGYLALQTEAMLQTLVNIMVRTHRDALPETELMRITNRWPLPVVRELRRLASNREYEVVVELPAGSGASRRQRAQEARSDYATGLRDRESTQTIIGIENPSVVNAKIDRDRQAAAVAQAPR
jgi:hypothetical protein